MNLPLLFTTFYVKARLLSVSFSRSSPPQVPENRAKNRTGNIYENHKPISFPWQLDFFASVTLTNLQKSFRIITYNTIYTFVDAPFHHDIRVHRPYVEWATSSSDIAHEFTAKWPEQGGLQYVKAYSWDLQEFSSAKDRKADMGYGIVG